MKKLFSKKVIFWTIGTLIVMIGGSLVAMNYAANYIIRSIIASSELKPSLTAPIGSSLGSGVTGSSIVNPQPIQSTAPESGAVNAQSDPGAEVKKTNTAESSSNSAGAGPTSHPTSTSASSTANGSTSANTIDYSAEITPEKVEQVQEEITLKEKAQVSSVLLKKLSPSDISLFVKMSGDGVTLEEKRMAKDIILQKLSEDEYNELIAIAAKLGLSRGKDYQNSLKEKK